MKTRIAICQLNPRASKPEDNFRTIEQTIKNYSGRKVKLFIFPEDFLYGILRDRKEILAAGKRFNFWANKHCSLAKKYKVDLIPGSFPLLKNGKLFNTTIYVNHQGRILNKYSKTNLWLSERNEYIINPKPPKCFESVLGKTIQIICWDLMDNKLFEQAVKQNTEWIVNTSLWSVNQSNDLARKRGKTKNTYNLSYRKSERLDSIIEARVTEYNVGIIFCNIGGVHKYIGGNKNRQYAKSAGSTQILAPLDGIRTKVNSRKQQILICDIPPIKEFISDHEILYGRREDIKNDYPHGSL